LLHNAIVYSRVFDVVVVVVVVVDESVGVATRDGERPDDVGGMGGDDAEIARGEPGDEDVVDAIGRETRWTDERGERGSTRTRRGDGTPRAIAREPGRFERTAEWVDADDSVVAFAVAGEFGDDDAALELTFGGDGV
jgi:hypothetical protein